MRRLWKMVAITAAVASCMVGIIQTQPVKADKPSGDQHVPVTICHSRQPQPSNGQGAGPIDNPYGPKPITVDDDAIMSEGHSGHDGPVFNNSGQDYWGDIIPPFTTTDGSSFAGLNWDAAGRAIWGNGCQYKAPDTTPDPGVADIHYAVICDVDEKSAVITFINNGDTSGDVVLNAETIAVLAEQSAVRTISTGENGVQITIVIDGETVYNEKVSCLPGDGGGPVTPPATTPPVATLAVPGEPATTTPQSLPLTSASGWLVTFIASGLAAVAMTVSTTVRSLLIKPF